MPSDVTQERFWSTGSGCPVARLGKKYSQTNHHLCSMSIPLFIFHISHMRWYYPHFLEEELQVEWITCQRDMVDWIVFPQNSYVEVLTPSSTLGWDCIGKQCLQSNLAFHQKAEKIHRKTESLFGSKPGRWEINCLVMSALIPALGFWKGLCIWSTCPLYFAKSEYIPIPATKQLLTEFVFPYSKPEVF